MKIPVKSGRKSIAAHRLLPIWAAPFALAACHGQPDENAFEADPVEQAVVSNGGEDCLVLVWDKQPERDEAFDLANDTVAKGGAISCATGTSASRFERVLARLRDAAARGDKGALLAETGIPLLYIDEEGNRQLLEGEDLDAAFEDAFPPDMLETLATARLSDMTVVPEEGGFFKLGALWLVVDEPGGDPKIVSVNRQALSEAAATARDKAERGEAIPIDNG